MKIFCAILILLSSGIGFAEKQNLQIEDEFQLEVTSDPQISPSGSAVVYVRQFSDSKTDKRYSNLWIVETNGSNHRPLTSGNLNDSSPRWSPDGSKIAFISNRDGSGQIHLLWLQTGQIARISNLSNDPSQLSWSPDGKWIAYLAIAKSNKTPMIKMPEKPEGAAWAEPAKVIDRLTYRFNRAGYLPDGYWHVFAISAEGGMPIQISKGDYHHTDFLGGAGAPVWSPDGKAILISANRRDDWDYEPLDTEVHEFSFPDGTVKTLTNRRGPDNSPAISPDGKSIAYVGFDDRYQGYQLTKLYIANRDGSSPKPISDSLGLDAAQPSWSKDGKGIYFTYEEKGITKLTYYTLDAKIQTIASNLGSGLTSTSGPTPFSIAKNGSIAFATKNWDSPGDVAVISSSGATPKMLTAVNQDLFSQRNLGTVEEVWFQSSKDQRKFEGWLIKPPQFDPSKKYPLILEIHGGPFANYGPFFDLEKQMYVAKGYLVLYTNPRGSTSYGEEFGNLIHHAYPGDDFYDLNSAVDAVIAKGFVDEKNLFVTGGSGGGVLTCWTIGHTDRFKAAAAAYPVINWTSWVLTSDLPAFGVKYWFPGLPWEQSENYQKRSLLSVVGNVKTPTMVITGEEDWRTPISESEQYYSALKLRKVESVMVRVPGEPHGIRIRPSHHIAKMLYIVGWFDKHRS
jgi:acylaminoacyl-peptidase